MEVTRSKAWLPDAGVCYMSKRIKFKDCPHRCFGDKKSGKKDVSSITKSLHANCCVCCCELAGYIKESIKVIGVCLCLQEESKVANALGRLFQISRLVWHDLVALLKILSQNLRSYVK